MAKKIKSALGVFFRGMFGGWRGAVGTALIVFSLYMLAGLFNGATNIQNYIRDKRELATADARIIAARKRLDAANQHIKLMREHSPDFVSEMAMKHLNLGDPGVRILKK